jgi:probable DNA metabolism protein
VFLSYDGSFEGLLSALTLCLREERAIWGILPERRAASCLLPCEPVLVEPDILARFDRTLSRRLSADVMELLFHAFLSEREDIELRILGFLRAGLRIGRDPSDMLQDPDVATVREAARAVGHQSHAYAGLLRFRLTAGVYVADFEPDYHLLPLVLPHFAERLGDQPFLIRDRRRSLAGVSWPDRTPFIIELDAGDPEDPDGLATTGSGGGLPAAPGESDGYEDAWRSYFAAMAVPQRIHPALQRSNMPKKYWKYLIERPGGSTGAGLRYNEKQRSHPADTEAGRTGTSTPGGDKNGDC